MLFRSPNSICAWNPDMYGLKCESQGEGALAYYESIFGLYASWGVDFVKVDDIAREYPHYKREIELISTACRNANNDMVLSLSPGPAPIEEAEHLKNYSNMWRITDDFWDEWRLLLDIFHRAEIWCTHSGPGHWPDADMLPVGALRQDYNEKDWTRFTCDEQITMMSLWCMMRSPLFVGADLPKNDDFTLKILTNEEVLEIQEKSHCAHQLYRSDSEVAWLAPRKDGLGCYLALFNISESDKEIIVNLADFELDKYKISKELWNQSKCDVEQILKAEVKKHGAVIYRFE